jgi:hypothetical protein
MRLVHALLVYPCSICGFEFSAQDELDEHLRVQHYGGAGPS